MANCFDERAVLFQEVGGPHHAFRVSVSVVLDHAVVAHEERVGLPKLAHVRVQLQFIGVPAFSLKGWKLPSYLTGCVKIVPIYI